MAYKKKKRKTKKYKKRKGKGFGPVVKTAVGGAIAIGVTNAFLK